MGGLLCRGRDCSDTLVCESFVVGHLKVTSDGSVRRGMIVFDCEQIVATFLDDLFSNRLSASHGVERDDRIEHVDQIEQIGNRCDFVGFSVGLGLGKRDSIFGRPNAGDMNRIGFLRIGIGSARRLAIDRNWNGTIVVLARMVPIDLAEMSVPLKRCLLKRGWFGQGQRSRDGIVRRNAGFKVCKFG